MTNGYAEASGLLLQHLDPDTPMLDCHALGTTISARLALMGVPAAGGPALARVLFRRAADRLGEEAAPADRVLAALDATLIHFSDQAGQA